MQSAPPKRDEGGPIKAEWRLACLNCGYSLTGLEGRVCPECGQRFSPHQTWESNRAGFAPQQEPKHPDFIKVLVAGSSVLALLALAVLTGHKWAGITGFVVIGLGELWIYLSNISPMAVRIMVGAICLFILMWVLIP